MKIINITILIILISSCILKAQFLQDINGKPLLETKYTDVIGTPYLQNFWLAGVVKMQSGKTFKNIELKYNLLDDRLLFRNPKDTTAALEFVENVKEFSITNTNNQQMVFKNGYPSYDKFDESTYYQMLFSGKKSLLKKNMKILMERKAYNTATAEKYFDNIVIYLFAENDKVGKLKISKKDLMEFFSDKKVEIENYLKKENINLKSDNDLVKVFSYYQSL